MDKNVLKRFAIESRKHLHEKVADRYALYYLDEEFDEVEKDELYTLTNEKHNLVLTKEQYEHRQKLLKKKDRYGKDHVIEEAAFTWFNRFICLRYMEIHNFLPLGKNNESLDIRVLSSRDGNKEPEILKRNNLANNSLDINVDIDKLEKIADINDKYEKVLLKVCEKMGKVLPQIFDGETDYIELLMPKNQLNMDSFLDKLLKEVPEDNFNDIEVIGWLYQYYNDLKRDEIKEKKGGLSKYEISYMTQYYTTDWIVKYMVENSLGRLWIENTGDELLESEFKYFIKDNIEINVGGKDNRRGEACEPLLPENIQFIDPCMGSGHILVYAFEVFMKLYISDGYNKKDIPELILKNNLYGLDIDDRAGQFAIISVMLKAREYDSEIFNKIDFNSLNILSIPESSPELRQYTNDIKDKGVREIVDYLINTFENGKEIGSLLIVEEKDYDKVTKYFEQATPTIINRILQEELRDIVRVAKILSKKYDVVVTNPPYLTIRKMQNQLIDYLTKEYVIAKYDLCTSFMLIKVLKEDGLMAMVNQNTWLTQESFVDFRKYILNNKSIINCIIPYENDMDGGLGICTFCIKNKHYTSNILFLNVEINEGKLKVRDKFNSPQIKFENTSDSAILYNLSDKMFDIYYNAKKLSEVAPTKQGLATSNNELFLKKWYEINVSNTSIYDNQYKIQKWIPCNKGGQYRKWYGNNEFVINWENDGQEVKKYASNLYGSYSRTIKNISYYFKQGITWNTLAKELSCRLVNEGYIFETKGSMMFPKDNDILYILALLNSNIIVNIAKIISPTLDFHEGPIGKLPVIIDNDRKNSISNISKICIDLSKKDWDSFETSWDFKKHPLV